MSMLASRTSRAALATTALAFAVVVGAVAARPAPAEAGAAPSEFQDNWLKNLNVSHKMLFDSPQPDGGIGLIHMMNYYDTYNSAYGVKDEDIRGVLTFYGMTTFHALNDEMWAKYRIGEFVNAEDPATKAPAVANPWRAQPVILGMTIPAASVESLQKRGAMFIVCNNALTILSGMLAQQRGLDGKAVYEDMKANLMPGVELVPAMVVALEQAHRAGMAYQRQ